MAFKTDRIRTHWEGCWRSHHDCAVAMIERLQSANEAKIGALVLEKMRSGNIIPVDRCIITAAEIAAYTSRGNE